MAAKDAVDKLCGKLQSGDRGGSDADRDLLLAFSDELNIERACAITMDRYHPITLSAWK